MVSRATPGAYLDAQPFGRKWLYLTHTMKVIADDLC
jgi:hypothetical protein